MLLLLGLSVREIRASAKTLDVENVEELTTVIINSRYASWLLQQKTGVNFGTKEPVGLRSRMENELRGDNLLGGLVRPAVSLPRGRPLGILLWLSVGGPIPAC